MNLIDKAKQLDFAGQTKTAAEIYKSLLAEDPYNWGLLVKYAHTEANHDRIEAVKEIDAFIGRIPENDYEGQARCIALKLPYLESERRVQAGLDPYSSDILSEAAFGFSDSELGDYGEAIKGWSSIDSLAPDCLSAQAFHLVANHKWKEADAVLTLCRRGGVDARISAARFTEIDTSWTVGENVEYHHEGNSHLPHVLTACDPAYWEKYGVKLLNSTIGQDICFHLHVYDADRDALKSCSDSLRKIFGSRYILSSERTHPRWRSNEKYYYAAARFPRLHGFIQRTSAPYLCLDTDIVVSGPLNRITERLETNDIVLCRMPGRLPLHTQINATISAFSQTKSSLEFLKYVSGFVSRALTIKDVPWCLDQISLHCVLRHFEFAGKPLNAIACGPKVYNGTFNDEVLLWPQKCTPENPSYEKWRSIMKRFSN